LASFNTDCEGVGGCDDKVGGETAASVSDFDTSSALGCGSGNGGIASGCLSSWANANAAFNNAAAIPHRAAFLATLFIPIPLSLNIQGTTNRTRLPFPLFELIKALSREFPIQRGELARLMQIRRHPADGATNG